MENIEEIAGFYRKKLAQVEKAWDFMENSRLDSEECSVAFKLGCSSREFGSKLAKTTTKEGGQQRQKLKELGILGEDNKPVLIGLVFPFFNNRGEVVDMYSHYFDTRSVEKDRFLNKKREGMIWIGGEKEIVLTNHPLEAAAIYSIGIKKQSSLLKSVACTFDTSCPEFRERCAKLEKIYLASDFDTEFVDWLRGTDCAIYLIHRETIQGGSFFEHLRGSILSCGSITNAFLRPSLISAPNAPSAILAPKEAYQIERDFEADCHKVAFAQRSYKLLALAKNKGFDVLKVRLSVWTTQTEVILDHDDQLDLCSDKQRLRFSKRAAEELGHNQDELALEIKKVRRAAEEIQEERRSLRTAPKKVELSPKEVGAAQVYLKDPQLIENLTNDLKTMGLEEESALAGFFCGVSRLMKQPLSAICEGGELSQRLVSFFPPESIKNHTSISQQALYYEGASKLEEKILCLDSLKSGEEISQLIKTGRISRLSVARDLETGGMKTEDVCLEYRPQLFLNETRDEELRRLCLNLKGCVVEGSSVGLVSIEAILAEQQKEALCKSHQNLQRLLVPMQVVNPLADKLSYPFQCQHKKSLYLRLIESITLFHQMQRETKIYKHGKEYIEYLETTAKDVALANKIASKIFQRSSLDELSPTLRKTFSVCAAYVQRQGEEWEKVEFSRKAILGTGEVKRTSLGNHLKKLIAIDFIEPVKGKNGVEMIYKLALDPASLDGASLKFNDPTKAA